VFDDFDDAEKQVQVSLTDKDERKDIMLGIENFMANTVIGAELLTDSDRKKVTGELINYLQKERVKRSIIKFVPKIGSALAKIAVNGGIKAYAAAHAIPL
jgi:hypothetical protein